MIEQQAQNEKEHREFQNRLYYYTIALCVSAIGFSVYQTTGKPLSCSQIPLGLAVLCWGISIYCGLTFLGRVLGSLYIKDYYFTIKSGGDEDIGTKTATINYAIKKLKDKAEEASNKAAIFATWHQRLFYAGMILFIGWHISEMYLKAKGQS